MNFEQEEKRWVGNCQHKFITLLHLTFIGQINITSSNASCSSYVKKKITNLFHCKKSKVKDFLITRSIFLARNRLLKWQHLTIFFYHFLSFIKNNIIRVNNIFVESFFYSPSRKYHMPLIIHAQNNIKKSYIAKNIGNNVNFCEKQGLQKNHSVIYNLSGVFSQRRYCLESS